jgi:hypothetical protein
METTGEQVTGQTGQPLPNMAAAAPDASGRPGAAAAPSPAEAGPQEAGPQAGQQEAGPQAGDAQPNQMNSFIALKEVARVSRGKALRLQADDVIVAIDGQIFQASIDDFLDILDECDEEVGVLLTIWRKGVIYNIIARGPLGGTFEHVRADIAEQVNRDFETADIGPRADYEIYEVLRDLHRQAEVIETRPSEIAVYLPPVWLAQNRLWEPLLAVSAIYGVTFAVHWVVFIIAAILLGLYFKRAQIALLRSFAIYRDKQMWLIVAARSMLEAQQVARKLDPKMRFRNSLVGDPVPEEPEKPAKKRRRSSVPMAA